MRELRITDYCALCGESPDSHSHLFDHCDYQLPLPRMTRLANGDPVRAPIPHCPMPGQMLMLAGEPLLPGQLVAVGHGGRVYPHDPVCDLAPPVGTVLVAASAGGRALVDLGSRRG